MFDRVVKYLDLRKATRDSTLVTKPLSLFKSRAIKKINTVYYFELVNSANTPITFWPDKHIQILYQFNVTAPKDFVILNSYEWLDLSTLGAFWRGITMVVKFREGNTVTRYRLDPIGTVNAATLTGTLWPWYFGDPYAQQTIKKNFCVEMWQRAKNPALPIGFADPTTFFPVQPNFRFVTSMLNNPDYAEETERVINVPLTYKYDELTAPFDPFLAVPLSLPMDNSNNAFLDNP